MTTKCISTGGVPVEVATPDDIPGDSITSSSITDATTVGKAVLTAADAAAARSAIGAGTPYTLPTATASVVGGVKRAAAITDLATDADAAAIVTTVNSLLAALRTAGVIATS